MLLEAVVVNITFGGSSARRPGVFGEGCEGIFRVVDFLLAGVSARGILRLTAPV